MQRIPTRLTVDDFQGYPEGDGNRRFARLVVVHRPEGNQDTVVAHLGEDATLTSPILPGFACTVAEFFADLPPEEPPPVEAAMDESR